MPKNTISLIFMTAKNLQEVKPFIKIQDGKTAIWYKESFEPLQTISERTYTYKTMNTVPPSSSELISGTCKPNNAEEFFDEKIKGYQNMVTWNQVDAALTAFKDGPLPAKKIT